MMQVKLAYLMNRQIGNNNDGILTSGNITEDQKEKRLLCSSVGFTNQWQNIHAAPTAEKSESIARNPKCETSFAIIATPNITNSAKLATEASVVPIRFALDDGIPVWRICVPTTSYDMCPNLDSTYI